MNEIVSDTLKIASRRCLDLWGWLQKRYHKTNARWNCCWIAKHSQRFSSMQRRSQLNFPSLLGFRGFRDFSRLGRSCTCKLNCLNFHQTINFHSIKFSECHNEPIFSFHFKTFRVTRFFVLFPGIFIKLKNHFGKLRFQQWEWTSN